MVPIEFHSQTNEMKRLGTETEKTNVCVTLTKQVQKPQEKQKFTSSFQHLFFFLVKKTKPTQVYRNGGVAPRTVTGCRKDMSTFAIFNKLKLFGKDSFWKHSLRVIKVSSMPQMKTKQNAKRDTSHILPKEPPLPSVSQHRCPPHYLSAHPQ